MLTKNWLFNVSQEGAEATALYYSLIATAKDNDVGSINQNV